MDVLIPISPHLSDWHGVGATYDDLFHGLPGVPVRLGSDAVAKRKEQCEPPVHPMLRVSATDDEALDCMFSRPKSPGKI